MLSLSSASISKFFNFSITGFFMGLYVLNFTGIQIFSQQRTSRNNTASPLGSIQKTFCKYNSTFYTLESTASFTGKPLPQVIEFDYKKYYTVGYKGIWKIQWQDNDYFASSFWNIEQFVEPHVSWVLEYDLKYPYQTEGEIEESVDLPYFSPSKEFNFVMGVLEVN